MKIIVLTSSLHGTAAHHLPYLLESKEIEVAMVVHSEGHIINKKRHYKRKLKKVLKIGILGALNGMRIRKWFGEDVKKYASIQNLEILCLQKEVRFERTSILNSAKTIQLFQEANADLGLSLGNGYIGKKIFSSPKYGMLNIHHEILPEYKNAQSIIWQIYNGSKETGFTIHKIDRHIDTGEILYQEKIPIGFKESLGDTVAYTMAELLKHSAKGLVKILENYEYYLQNSRKQGPGNSYTTPSIFQFLKMKGQFNKIKKQNLLL